MNINKIIVTPTLLLVSAVILILLCITSYINETVIKESIVIDQNPHTKGLIPLKSVEGHLDMSTVSFVSL